MDHNNRSALHPGDPSHSTTRVGDPMIPPPPRFYPRRFHEKAESPVRGSCHGVHAGGSGSRARNRQGSDPAGRRARRESQHQHGGRGRAGGPPRDRQGLRRENHRIPPEKRSLQEGRGHPERPRDRREDLREDPGQADHRQELRVHLRGEGGFTLLEATLALFLLGLLAAVATPALFAALSRGRVTVAARDLGQEMARLRSEAIASRRDVAMRLTWSGGRYRYAFYADGDGDGVRSDDIAAGRDPVLGAWRDLPTRYEGIDFSLPEVSIPEVPPDPGVLTPGSDPVRFGRSDIITFTPRGTSSSGTLYVGY